jgi:membrane protein YdbS with pleckstrin-like domain
MSVKDLWSRWVDWTLTADNGKFLPAMEQVGGQVISVVNNSYIPIYITLINGWRIRPAEENATIDVTEGVLLTSENTTPFVQTIGNFNVQINYVQPVSSISVTTAATGTDLATIQGTMLALQNMLGDAMTKKQYIALS